MNNLSNKIYGIYGASGFGREVMPLLKAQLPENSSVFFIDDSITARKKINGIETMCYDEFIHIEAKYRYISIAIADSRIREKLSHKLRENHIIPLSISANNIVAMDEIEIGEGSILSPFVTLTSNIKIGKYFHANIYSYIAHDCVIGDYVTFAPSVKCNGNVHISDHAYIGTGAIIKQGSSEKPLIIGEGAIVGMGAVVTKDVAPNTIVVGNPAKFLKKV